MREDFQKMIGRGFSFLQIIVFEMPSCKVKIIFGKTPNKESFKKILTERYLKYNFVEAWQSTLGLCLYTHADIFYFHLIATTKKEDCISFILSMAELCQKKLTSIW